MFQEGVRESMSGLPIPFQPILTWLTGKPLNKSEKIYATPKTVDIAMTPLIGALAVQLLALLAASDSPLAWLLILPLWIVSVGVLRKLQVTHLHHAIHNRLFGSATLNKVYSRLIPAIIFVQNGREYKKEHLAHHNADIFTTKQDADAAFLAQLGFIPGRTRKELWQTLWITILSPAFHALFLQARLRSILIRGKNHGRTLAWFMVGMHLLFVAVLGLKVYLIAVFIPLTVLYHISALLQFLTEHAWDVTASAPADWDAYAARCWGRFCGERYPERSGDGLIRTTLHIIRVATWSARMLVIHAPVRLGCLVSDLPAHDWHHLAHLAGQNSRDWTRSLYLRQAAIACGDRPGFAKRELWGISTMIEHQFGCLECAQRGPSSSAGRAPAAAADQQLLVAAE
ncbi:stearoyl-CoA 9-desaturase [Ralstonia pickettii]|uniref:Stearoyl-CoA 9-desaturase n=1 Tax=Ralstonia pickettii TaxID=329 RepID=A0A2N4TSN7_RALPI|nr:fatty acid desaturase [Ralstonia pickettii]PLC42714.1 stearoyl-CoA 9-desaturase [Ralstonia pickettii]